MRLALLAALFALALAGCALRPRYADFVTPKTDGKEIAFVLTDPSTGQPIPNAKIELSELRNRLQLTTGADGTFKLPNEKKYLDENPVFVVTLPKGFAEYRVALAPPPAPPAPPAAPAEPLPVPTEVDAGVPSNG
jgi:hypothetical protein